MHLSRTAWTVGPLGFAVGVMASAAAGRAGGGPRCRRGAGTAQLTRVDGRPTARRLPASVELEVVETEPGVKGDTVSNVTKPATLETGAVVTVPMFVNIGERIKVDTREARYISRA